MASLKGFKQWVHVVIAMSMCVGTLLWVMPSEVKFGYEYEVGRPWRYASLMAPFEFPISKSEEELSAERDSALLQFSPYFDLQTSIGTQYVQHFRADYARGLFRGIPAEYVAYAVDRLEEVYAAGVVDPDAYDRLQHNNTKNVRIVSNATAEQAPVTRLFSPRSAYDFIMDDGQHDRQVLSRLELNKYLHVNLLYDSLKTVEGQQEVLDSIPTNIGMVMAGQQVVELGEVISPYKKNILDSMRKESENLASKQQDAELKTFVGRAGIVVFSLLIFLGFLYMFRARILRQRSAIYMIFSLLTLFPAASALLQHHRLFSVYVLPFVMVSIVVRIFLDSRTAFLTHMFAVLLAAIPLHNDAQFIIIQLLVGQITLFSIKSLTERSQLIRSSFFVTLATWFLGFCFDMAAGVSLDHLDRTWYWFVGINGVLLLFTYPLLYMIEQLFGFTSNVTLVEMNNINHPLLRRLAKEAQGTFVHSMQVANLAAEVANKIGADVLLVRTAALYHDIGKTFEPAFFTENQGLVNPHEQLDERQSAAIIIGHVTKGLSLAEKTRLPKPIRDFIATHHGTSLVKYFYVQAVNKYGEAAVDKSAFTYPGPNPFTREQAILMMCDSVEAASKSLQDPTEENITVLVHDIVDAQVREGYFSYTPITFRDITDAKSVLIESLKVMYHTRIAYPALKPQRAESASQDGSSGGRLFGIWNHRSK